MPPDEYGRLVTGGGHIPEPGPVTVTFGGGFVPPPAGELAGELVSPVAVHITTGALPVNRIRSNLSLRWPARAGREDPPPAGVLARIA